MCIRDSLYAKDVLEKAFGPEQASSYMDRLSKSLRTRSFESIRKADYKNLWICLLYTSRCV